MHEVVLPASLTIGILGLMAAVGLVAWNSWKGSPDPVNAIHYVVSGSIFFLYFVVAMPWVSWLMFEAIPQPGNSEAVTNDTVKFFMRSSQVVGIIELVVAAGMLVKAGVKGNLKIKYTWKVLGVATVLMLFFAAALPWLLAAPGAVPNPK